MKKALLFSAFFTFSSSLLTFSQTITTLAGNGTAGYYGDGGPATAAEFNYPEEAAVDYAGNVYIGDYINQRIRMVNTSGIITTVAGTGVANVSGMGGPATAAQIEYPCGITADSAGNFYFVCLLGAVVCRVDHATGIINIVAGTGTGGYSGDGGQATAAEISDPEGVSLDDSDNVYIIDTGNYRIRKVDKSTGIITTLVGNGVSGFYGDGGPATAAEISHMEKVKSDKKGNLYVPDENNNRVRYYNAATGIITTVAGNGVATFGGDGGQATAASLAAPEGVTLDNLGNFYVADLSDNHIREINISTGIITSVAGTGVAGYSGDGGPATAAKINGPVGVTFDYTGNMYIGDAGNNRIRKINGIFVTGIPDINPNSDVKLYPNPNQGVFTIESSVVSGKSSVVEIYNMLGKEIYSRTFNIQNSTFNISDQPAGIYMYRIIDESGKQTATGKFVIE